MIVVDYKAKALEPLLHGSEEQASGNKRRFRRMKLTLPEVKRIKSHFSSDEARRQAAIAILFGIYKAVDKKLKDDYYGYHDQFIANVKDAAYARNKGEFFSRLCKLCGVASLEGKYIERAVSAIAQFSDEELLWTMRTEAEYLHILVRDFLANDGQPSLFSMPADAEPSYFEVASEQIPFIHGNAIGGILRRLVIRDYLDRIGYVKELHGINKSLYHQLMTGGNIEASTASINIGKKEEYIRLCPMVGLLGSALGDMTLTSKIKIGSLYPVCKEISGEAAHPSYWDVLGTAFGTRNDTSKGETDIVIVDAKEGRNADQMIHFYECINKGTILEGRFSLTATDELTASAFYHALSLLKEYAHLAGRSARGHGRVSFSYDVPKGASSLYLSHLEDIKPEAQAFFFTSLQPAQ